MKRPLAVIGLTYLATSAVAVCFFPEINFILCVMAAITAIAACFIFSEKLRDILLIICPIAIALLIIGCCQIKANRLSDSLGEKSCIISGEICEIPRNQYGRWRYTIDADSVDIPGVNRKIRILMTSRSALEEAKEGDRITCEVQFLQSNNETGYNSTTSLRAGGIDARCWCKTYSEYHVEKGKFHVRYLPQKIKRSIVSAIRKALPKRAAAMLCGMLLGDTVYMESSTVDNFRAAGISHLLAVSGLHLTLLTLALQMILKKLRVNFYAYLYIVAFFILSFMAVTGFPPSVVRAGTMHILSLFSVLFYRNADGPTSLSFAILLMCIVNPWSAADIGLQMSVCSTLGLLLTRERLYKSMFDLSRQFLHRIDKMPQSSAIRKFGKKVIRSLSVSLSAVFLTLPLTAIHFGSVSIISPVTNLLCVYASSVFIVLGLIASLIYCIPVIGWMISLPLRFAAGVLCAYLETVASLLANLPFSTVNSDFSYTPYLFLFIVLLLVTAFIMYRLMQNENFARRLRGFVLCEIAVLLFAATLSHQFFCCGAEIIIFDAGEGGVCVCAKNRTHALFAEAGGDSYGLSVIKEALRGKGVMKIDAITVSDNSETRSGNFSRIIEYYSPDHILTDIDMNVRARAVYAKKSRIDPFDSTVINNSLALRTETFTDVEGKKWLRLTCGGIVALVCPEKGNCALLPEEWRSCDAVIIGKDIMGIALLRSGAVITTAKEKSAETVRNRLQSMGCRHIFSTCENGSITLSIKDGKLLIHTDE